MIASELRTTRLCEWFWRRVVERGEGGTDNGCKGSVSSDGGKRNLIRSLLHLVIDMWTNEHMCSITGHAMGRISEDGRL